MADASPQLVLGEAAPERFRILENSVRYEMSFNEGYSVGLFLDQRDNRRRPAHRPHRRRFRLWTLDFGLWTFELFRLHLRLLRVRGESRRADDQP